MTGTARRLLRDRRGLAVLEFALCMPILMTMSGYGVELANYSIVNMRVNQIALQLADNAGRIGTDVGTSTYQLREGDINDVLQGGRLYGARLALTTNGRIVMSSLENVQQGYDTKAVQRIHWQRCIGLRRDAGYTSSYGSTTASAGSSANAADAGVDMPDGIGDPGAKVLAPPGSGVMFIEINYEYQPVFGALFMSKRKIHYTASFVVRDNRDYSRIFNPSPTATPSTCDLYTS